MASPEWDSILQTGNIFLTGAAIVVRYVYVKRTFLCLEYTGIASQYE